MIQIADWMREVAIICQEATEDDDLNIEAINPEIFAKLRDEVRELSLKFPVPGI